MLDMSNDEVTWEAITEIKEYVDNGILFFIYNKVNFMSHEDILAICKDFYTEEDVVRAKEVMYTKYKCPDKAKVHRGGTKKVNDIKEMITFLSENVSSDVIFCITKCTQVPSVSLEFIDAPSMSRHMSLLRMEMELMSAKYLRLSSKIEDMESRMDHLKKEDSPLGEDGARILNHEQTIQEYGQLARRGKPNLSAAEVVRKNTGPIKDGMKNVGQRKKSPVKIGLAESTTDEEREEDDTWKMPKHEYKKFRRSSNRKMSQKSETTETKEDGVVNRRQRRKPPIIGKGDGRTLKAAQPLRNMTLFVSRLQPEIASELLISHVSHIAGVSTVDCEQVDQRHSHYRSFKVSIKAMLQSKVKDLYNPESWDKDILVRRWYD